MNPELEREESKQMLQGTELSSYPKSLDPGFCPPIGVIKTGKGAELTVLHREEMGKFWRRTVVSPSFLPEGTHAVPPCCYITFGFSTS